MSRNGQVLFNNLHHFKFSSSFLLKFNLIKSNEAYKPMNPKPSLLYPSYIPVLGNAFVETLLLFSLEDFVFTCTVTVVVSLLPSG